MSDCIANGLRQIRGDMPPAIILRQPHRSRTPEGRRRLAVARERLREVTREVGP
jgi:hypothetical protein